MSPPSAVPTCLSQGTRNGRARAQKERQWEHTRGVRTKAEPVIPTGLVTKYRNERSRHSKQNCDGSGERHRMRIGEVGPKKVSPPTYQVKSKRQWPECGPSLRAGRVERLPRRTHFRSPSSRKPSRKSRVAGIVSAGDKSQNWSENPHPVRSRSLWIASRNRYCTRRDPRDPNRRHSTREAPTTPTPEGADRRERTGHTRWGTRRAAARTRDTAWEEVALPATRTRTRTPYRRRQRDRRR